MDNTKSKNMLKCPIAIEWTFKESCLKEMKDKPGKSWNSNTFNACDAPAISYFVDIDSYKSGHERHGEIWIFMHLKFTEKIKIETDFNISIESAQFNAKKKHIFEIPKGYGGRCCKTEDLFDPEKNFIVDGKITIKEWVNQADSLCIGLWKQENKDFVIVVEGKEVNAHKLVLSTRSPVFARMFQSGMKEAQENKVEIKDFSFELVEAAIKLCYHHSLVTYISLENKMKLLQFLDKYDIQQLKDDLETYLISVINEYNVCRLANCSILTNATKLEMKCAEFLRKCLNTKPIADFDLLDKDFAIKMIKNAFCHVSQ